jgi:hypothetical protein
MKQKNEEEKYDTEEKQENQNFFHLITNWVMI